MDLNFLGTFPVSYKLIFFSSILAITFLGKIIWILSYLKFRHQKEKYSSKHGKHPSHHKFHNIKYHIWALKHLPIKLQPKSVRNHPHQPYSLKDNFLILLFHPTFGALRRAIALWLIFTFSLCAFGIYSILNSSKAHAAGIFSVKTGYYLGNGSTLSITGVGFRPQLIIVKSDTAAGSMIWKSSAMAASVSTYLGVATADNTETEITLDADGFTVSPAPEVNATNVRYTYTAFYDTDNCLSSGTMCVSTYSGSGAATKDITSGFQPDLVWVKRSTAVAGNFRTSSMPTPNYAAFFAATANDTSANFFTTLNPTGFTVGLSNNANAGLYYFAAFKNVPNSVYVGSFTGDGLDNKNITSPNFEPDFVLVKQNSANAAVFNNTETWGDYSSFTTATLDAANNIQDLTSTGFQVGNSVNVNANTIASYYFVFGGAPDPTPSGSFLMQSGNYTGNGVAGKVISLSFKPDLIIVKANTAQFGVWSTSLDTNLTHYFANAVASFANGITAMGTDSFTVGTDNSVNQNLTTYEYIAFGNALSPHTSSGASDFVIGKYIGNTVGTGKVIDHLGIAPDMVVSGRDTGAFAPVWRSSSMPVDSAAYFTATVNIADGSVFKTLNSDGFTIGLSTSINVASVNQTFFAFKQGSDTFKVGSYSGTGVAQSITGLGFSPGYVWTKRNIATAVGAVHRSNDPNIAGANAQYFLASANAVNLITALGADGFTLGTANDVNVAGGGTYYYSAWKSTTSTSAPNTPSNSSPSDSSTGQDLNPTLTGSDYSDLDANAQTDSQWQVDDDSDFSSPVWTRTAGTSGATTSITSAQGTFANELSGKTELAHDTTYYWRTRYSDGVYSSWSSATSFTTNSIATPTNTSPSNTATVTTLTPTLTAAAFDDPQSGHSAQNAQWQINTSSSFSSPIYDSDVVSYGNSLVVPDATLSDKGVFYWRVRYQDSSGYWSSYSTPTRFLVSQSVPTITVKPVFGNTVVDQADSVNVDVQVLSSNGSALNSATVTLNIYNPSGTKIVTNQAMSHISSSNGIYRYTYTIPSINGSYLYEATATWDSITGYGATNFEVRTISADVNSIKTSVNSLSSSVATLITEVGTGNIAAIKTKTDSIAWDDITGIVTSNGQIKNKTDTIDWATVSAIKTSTDTISWSDVTGISNKSDTINTNLTSVGSSLSTVNTNVNSLSSNFSTMNANIATLISEIGTGNIAAIKTKTDSISWSDITGIVTSNGQIKAKTDTINWDDVTALKTKTDTINWSDITGIKSKTDTINWNDVTAVKNATVSITGSVLDSSPSASEFKTSLSSLKDSFYKNMVITFTSGENSGQSRRISNYTGSDKKINVDPELSYTPVSGDTFLISVGSVRAEELSGSARSTIESIQSQLNILSGTLPTSYSGMYKQLVAIASQLSSLGLVEGAGASSLYSVSFASKDDINYLKNKLLDLQAALEINKAMLAGGKQNSIFSSWYTFNSVVINLLIANPTTRDAKIPFKAYLPKEARPEYVISSDGFTVEFDEGAQAYFVSGEFELGPKESITKKVEIKDIWQIDESELNSFKSQANDLYKEAQKTSYSAQSLILKNDILTKVDKILRKQKDNNANPQEHIQTFRENQDDLTSVKSDLKSMTDLVTSAGAGRGLLASVGGIQTISTWGIVVILIVGLGLLAGFSYSMWKHQMMVVAALSSERFNQGQANIGSQQIFKSVINDASNPSLSFSLPSTNVNWSKVVPEFTLLIILAVLSAIFYLLLQRQNFNFNSILGGKTSDTPTPTLIAKPTNTPTPTPVKKKITIKDTETGWLNVRSDASSKSKILEKVDTGDTFEELDRKENDLGELWIQIKLTDGSEGWLLGKYAKVSSNN